VTSHYDVLGVRRGASAEEIKRAYYRRARGYHPDAHAGSTVAVLEEAQRAMAELNSAWTVLRDEELRWEYDSVLAEADRPVAGARPGDGDDRWRPGQPTRRPKAPAQISLAHGFRYWMSGCGSVSTTEEGRPRFHLGVEGATDLSPLRELAPNGLWGLHADGIGLGDAQLAHLGGMQGLQLLDLSGTRVGDAGLVHLQHLESLETLHLWHTRVTDAGLALLGRIRSLCLLGVGHTLVTDAGLAHLRGLHRLRVLQLWGTGVTGPGLEHLHGLGQLELVSLPRRVRGGHRRRLRAALPHTTIL